LQRVGLNRLLKQVKHMTPIPPIPRHAPAPGAVASQSQIKNHKSQMRRRHRHRGFTLIEAALTTVIVGTGVLAIVAAQQAYHRKNDWAGRMGTAILLANELRELTMVLPMNDPITGSATLGPENGETAVAQYDDLDDFAGAVSGGYGAGIVFNPPINALRQQIPNMPGWTQEIHVDSVLSGNISSTFTQPLNSTDLMRVTVTVRYQRPQENAPMTMTTLTWVVGR